MLVLTVWRTGPGEAASGSSLLNEEATSPLLCSADYTSKRGANTYRIDLPDRALGRGPPGAFSSPALTTRAACTRRSRS